MKKELGTVIKACRRQCELKQEYLAYKLKISVNSYANLENGKFEISMDKLYILAKEFGLKGHQILALAEEILEEQSDYWLASAINFLIKPNMYLRK